MTWTNDYMRFARRFRDYEGLTLDALKELLDVEYAGMNEQERTYILAAREARLSNNRRGLDGLRSLADGDYGLLSFYAKTMLSEIDEQDGS